MTFRAHLIEQLGSGFRAASLKSGRSLILREEADDLQVGLLVQTYQKHGVWDYLVDMGVQIPSVENYYERYELHEMRQMKSKNPKPIGWLTFWRPTYSSLEIEQQGLEMSAILRDLNSLRELILVDPEGFRSETLELLCQARRPKWATLPGSTFLVIKALVARTLRYPEIDACTHIDELAANEDIQGYEVEMEWFCQWLRSVQPELGDA